jgi:hypothetical protein
VFHNEVEHVACFTARPASEALPFGINLKRWAVIVVEGAKAFERVTIAGWMERQISADDGHDVVGLADLLGQGRPIYAQRETPAGTPDSPAAPIPD